MFKHRLPIVANVRATEQWRCKWDIWDFPSQLPTCVHVHGHTQLAAENSIGEPIRIENMRDLCFNLTRAGPTLRKNQAHFESSWEYYLIISYGIPYYLLPEKGTQLASKLFEPYCHFHWVEAPGNKRRRITETLAGQAIQQNTDYINPALRLWA